MIKEHCNYCGKETETLEIAGGDCKECGFSKVTPKRIIPIDVIEKDLHLIGLAAIKLDYKKNIIERVDPLNIIIATGENNIANQIFHLKVELAKVKKDAREAVNTAWRFINAYEKKNAVPIEGALKSAKYHLKEIDYIFQGE